LSGYFDAISNNVNFNNINFTLPSSFIIISTDILAASAIFGGMEVVKMKLGAKDLMASIKIPVPATYPP